MVAWLCDKKRGEESTIEVIAASLVFFSPRAVIRLRAPSTTMIGPGCRASAGGIASATSWPHNDSSRGWDCFGHFVASNDSSRGL